MSSSSSAMKDLRARYDRDGYVIVEGLMTPEEVELLRVETLKICRNEASAAFFGQIEDAPRSDDEALDRYLAVHFPHKISVPIKDVVAHHEPTNAVLRALIGSPNIKACQSMLFMKPPGDPGQAWHQDEFYIPTRDRSLTANWVALDDTDVENGCLWVWPKSHRRGVIYPHEPHNLPYYDSAPLAEGHGYLDSEAVPVPMKAGDVLFFHGYLLHRSLENKPTSGRRRRVLTNHYLSAESLLPWQGETDHRDVLLCCGEDPYAYKGTVERNRPWVRPRKADDAYMKAFRNWQRENPPGGEAGQAGGEGAGFSKNGTEVSAKPAAKL